MRTATAHEIGPTRTHSYGTSHPPEVAPGPSDAGCVVLDIGPGAGVAVVMTPDSLNGTEIEIRRTGETWRGAHVAVRPRRSAVGTQYAAIFGSLPQGSYDFRVRGACATLPALTLQVEEGGVALAHWPVTTSGGG